MSDTEKSAPLKLDPWAASSLLQKSIRRGEADLARRAVQALYRHRGVGIFRRLCGIAVEDIGIADPTLVQHVVRLASDRPLRGLLGCDPELLDDLCSRMSAAAKDRSADYLYCAATKLPKNMQERLSLERLTTSDLLTIAASADETLERRAVATLLVVSAKRGEKEALDLRRTELLLNKYLADASPIHDAVSRLARARAHPFCAMLPVIWSAWSYAGHDRLIVQDALPEAEFCGGIPLHTFDKHSRG